MLSGGTAESDDGREDFGGGGRGESQSEDGLGPGGSCVGYLNFAPFFSISPIIAKLWSMQSKFHKPTNPELCSVLLRWLYSG